ncbi:MAG: N-6 DNA methylase, partial [Alphaproteobacteria bacterium]|nr:N-6 DNA methylase [Alphaproteobacteria bacterium]
QKEITELAIENVRLNKMEQNIKFITGDVADVPKELRDTQFHHVMTNPPFVSCGTSPADSSKAVAHMETSANLAVWLDFCIRKLKPKGTLTLIHRADRLDEILSLIYGRVGGIEVIPLYPKVGKNAKRVIVRGRKSFKSPMIMSAGLVLHEGDCYTPETENILREMKPLE